MTIFVCAVIPDGIVMGTDSRQLSTTGPKHVRISSDHAEKVFRLRRRTACALVGQGCVYTQVDASPISVRTLIAQATVDRERHFDIEQTVVKIHRILKEAAIRDQTIRRADAPPVLQCYLAGFGRAGSLGRLYRISTLEGPMLDRTTEDAGLVWNGQKGIVDRIMLGYDPAVVRLAGQDGRETTLSFLRTYGPQLQLHVDFQTMALQEAANLVYELIRVSIVLQQLSDGILGMPGQFPACGGEPCIAALSPHMDFRWLSRHRLAVPTPLVRMAA